MDKLSAAARSRNMSAIRSKGMKPEIAVRLLAHSMGYRFRLHAENLPGKPDLVFPARRAVVFVHGCFWHQHQAKTCKIVRVPKSNLRYWRPKLTANRTRDVRNRATLLAEGWRVLVIWECSTSDEAKLAGRLRKLLGPPSSTARRVA